MVINMETEEYIMFFEEMYPKDEDKVGEREFFEFMKRANRDLTSHQRYRILNKTINMIRR